MNKLTTKTSAVSALSVKIFNSDKVSLLNDVDRSIIENATYASIGSLDRAEVLRRVSEWSKTLPIVIGLKNKIDEPTQVVIADYLVMYYKSFTFAEVMFAFDLLVTNDLDEFIKEDDKKHFQMFSVDYLGNILRAYKRKKNVAVHNGFKVLDEREETEVPQEVNDNILSKIKALFDDYEKTGIYNEEIVRPFVAFGVLSGSKGISRLPISDKHIDTALNIMERRIKMRTIHESIIWQYKKEKQDHFHVRSYANMEAMKDSVTVYFDELIKENKII